MKLASSFGGVWKMSDAAYKRLLKDVIAGKEWNFNDYGKYIGEVVNLSDLDEKEAQWRLKEFGEAKNGIQP